ncbi:N-acetylmuramoyl-L-alanine amidase [Anaerovoracaceae bacterium 41-7]|nr:hypothetical protein [Emergencia sp.]
MRVKKGVMVLLLLAFVCFSPSYSKVVETAGKMEPQVILVLDAGHGGMDGGAIGGDGTKEQKINLDIVKALQEEAENYGMQIILTRATEDGLIAEGTEKWTKVGDLKARKEVIEAASPTLTISIHLNSFPSDSSVHGAQVFYPKEVETSLMEDSKEIAEKIQESLKEELGDGADRIVLPKSGMYLFRNADHPMILVECGFLSNPEDLGNLKNPTYQQKIAEGIISAVAEYYNLSLSKNGRTKIVDSRTNP